MAREHWIGASMTRWGRWALGAALAAAMGCAGVDSPSGGGGDGKGGAADVPGVGAGDSGTIGGPDAAADVTIPQDVTTPDISKPTPDTHVVPDTTEDAGGGDTVGPDATGPDATGPDSSDPDAGGPDADVASGLPFGEPCTEDGDCALGPCVEAAAGKLCSGPCDGGCPDGWVCGEVGGAEACVSGAASWCNPCTEDADCAATSPEARCVLLGDAGSFCGVPCDAGCPDGATCELSVAADGAQVEQCVPAEGECACRASAVEAALETACTATNEHGSCAGVRACGPDGLSACSAVDAAPEACGGGDEDCDGATDEEDADGCTPYHEDADGDGFGAESTRCLCAPEGAWKAAEGGDCDDTDGDVVPGAPCGVASCLEGTLLPAPVCEAGVCVAGDGVPCPGGYGCADATACLEACTSAADCMGGFFCDGAACAPTLPDGAPCEEADACTGGACANGVCCAGGACCTDAAPCDDGNPCTDDACEAFACVHTPNTAPCGAPSCLGATWTGPATCADGACGAPETATCTTGDPCKLAACDPEQGCVVSDAQAGAPCGATACDGATLTSGQSCDGQGTCADGAGAGPCPGGFTCLDAAACRTVCTAPEHCQDGHVCDAGLCAPLRADGDPCDQDLQCASGHCGNGFCCADGDCCAGDADCDDADPCTADTCVDHQCAAAPTDAACSAGACEELTWVAPATCADGACPEPVATSCGGGDICRTYGCDPAAGCTEGFADPGVLCAPATCDGFVQIAESACDGDGACAPGPVVGPCPGGFVCADASSCRASCATGADCQPGLTCKSSACVPQVADGAPCVLASDCLSGHCEGGTCCAGGDCCETTAECDDANPCTDDACVAYACVHAPNTAVCGDASCTGLDYTAPRVCTDGACPPAPAPTSCQGEDPCKTYFCGASGCAQANAPAGGACKLPSCTGHELTASTTCDGLGGCTIGGGTEPCPGGYACLNATSCRTQCQSDDHCGPTHTCKAGVCSAKHEDGQACATDAQCLSGHCSNQVCCQGGDCCTSAASCDDADPCTNDACEAFACTHTVHTGTCDVPHCDGLTHVAGGTCVDGVCTAGAEATCGGANPCLAYGCDPDGGCQESDQPAGFPCGPGSCSGYTLTTASACDGQGQCKAGAGSGPCPGGFTCADALLCRTSCDADEHCRPGFYCQATVCAPKRAPGEPCTQAKQCDSGHCSNGFCCAAGKCCGGNDSQCNDNNVCTDDTCGPDFVCLSQSNSVQCAAPTCQGTVYVAATVCSNGICSQGGGTTSCLGTNPCKVYGCGPGGCTETNSAPGALCALPSCKDGLLTNPKSCNGAGACSVGGSSEPCPGGFACLDEATCRTQCTADSHCDGAHRCQGGKCVPRLVDGSACAKDGDCLSDHCGGGLCCATGDCCTEDVACDDDDPCTDDACHDFVCQHPFNEAPCSPPTCDGLVWGAPGSCADGVCEPSTAMLDCGGADPCVLYGCDPEAGCTVDAAPPTIPCGIGACSGHMLTPAALCDGAGACGDPAAAEPCPGGNVCADATSCRTSCGSDDQCQPDWSCIAGACFPRQPDGAPCATAAECLSDYCGNGICCLGGECCVQDATCDDGSVCSDDACVGNQCAHTANTALCEGPACDGGTLLGERFCSDFVCQPAAVETECTGTQVCRVYGCSDATCTVALENPGTPCGEGFCADGTLTSGLVCDAAGECVPGEGSGPCPGGLACLNATACRTSCTTNAHCRADFYCKSGVCLLLKEDGDACTGNVQCLSGHCTNGFCCATGKCCGGNDAQCGAGSCAGLVHTSAESCGAGFQCAAPTVTTCTATGACMVATCHPVTGCGAAPAAGGTPCGEATCAGGLHTKTRTCDGLGACSPEPQLPCPGGFGCASATACATSCAADADCQIGHFCLNAQCEAKRTDGQPCEGASQCESGYCGGGACCQNDGSDPHCCGPEVECPGGTCDGTEWTSPDVCGANAICQPGTQQGCGGEDPCKLFGCDPATGCTVVDLGDGTPCGEPLCTGFMISAAPTCAAGACGELPSPAPCPGGFVCASRTACATGCASDAACQQGLFCNGGACEPKRPNGGPCAANNECASSHCENGVCCSGGTCCSTPDQCDDGNVCTGNACVNHQCVSTPLDGQLCAASACNPDGSWTAPKHCAAGQCTLGGQTTQCTDGDVCTAHSCNAATGCQVAPIPGCCNTSTECDDGLVCTTDSCVANACVHETVSGCCQSDADCSSGNICLIETCDVPTGDCKVQANNGAVCNDGNQCTVTDTCFKGQCFGTVVPDGTLCDDGDPNTTGDACIKGTCACLPDCTGRVCGGDGCGGYCGTCPLKTDLCTDDGQCLKLGDRCENPYLVTGAPFVATGTTSGAAHDYGFSAGQCPGTNQGGGMGSPDRVYAFTPSKTAVYNVRVTPQSSFDASLYVLGDCDDPDSCVAGSNTPIAGAHETLQLALVQGEAARIVVDGPQNSPHAGYYQLAIEECVPQCAGKECGDNGCGGVCGVCDQSETCTSGLCIPVGDRCDAPFEVGPLPFETFGSTADASNDYGFSMFQCPGEPFAAYGGASNDEVWRFVAPASGWYKFELTPSFDSVLYLTSSCPGSGSWCLQANEEPGVGTPELLTYNLSNGQTVYLVVDGAKLAADKGAFALRVEAGCNNDAGCAAGEYCTSGLCKPKAANGGACSAANQCTSGYCNNGYCCNSGACCASAANCNDGNPCTKDSCNAANTCSYVNEPNGTICKPETCTGGVYYRADECSNGTCVDMGTNTYACGDKLCHTVCESGSSCAADCALAPAHDLMSGETDAWSTSGVGSGSHANRYSCNIANWPGNEYVYGFSVGQAGTLSLEYAPASGGASYLMVLRGDAAGCNPNECVTFVPPNSTVPVVLDPGEYCLVADYSSSSGGVPFKIHAQFMAADGTCHATLFENWERTNWPRAWTYSNSNWTVGTSTSQGTVARYDVPYTYGSQSASSPQIQSWHGSTIGCASSTKLSFKWTSSFYSGSNHTLRAFVSTNDGASWTQVWTTTGISSPGWQTATIDVPALASKSAVKVGFAVTHYCGFICFGNGDYYAVDDVRVGP